MKLSHLILLTLFLGLGIDMQGQEVPILNYSTTAEGQVLLEIASDVDHYYILKVRHDDTSEYSLTSSMTLGEAGTTVISESLESYPIEHYQVLAYQISSPFDSDGDGEDDISEYHNRPTESPLNFASPVNSVDGLLSLQTQEELGQLSVDGLDIPWAPFLNGREFLKFSIVDALTDHPRIYFINTNIHERHHWFYNAVGIDYVNEDVLSGEIIYFPLEVSNNGTIGAYGFSYSEGYGNTFEIIQKSHELLAANMPFLNNNLSYFVTANGEQNYQDNQGSFDSSRVSVLFESDVYGNIDFLGINPAEGYGRLRVMDLEETPSARDIVLYEALPNNLPRVGGIITAFIQTPLSHVNLRAIQDNIPNAFIKDPLMVETINELVDRYVHFKVGQNSYQIEEATLDEVNAWHEANRPTETQFPPLNLSYTDILPLNEITFGMSDGYGAKASNVATMLTFGFPENTIPNGYGVPFYFYREFMNYNGFFEQIETMTANPEFQNDIDTRVAMLKALRRDIKDAEMPQWMLDELQEMHESFPPNTPIRVRSSTNNEDLPGFSGAGLYSSKTQHPDEGHISKSIKQVYASIWNFRAFEEREYYRVSHFIASMGALCHPNYEDEKANGVGVTTDPIYQSEDTFYLNTQVGEDLITNPDAFSIPEELLLARIATSEDGYVIVRKSNQVENGEQIMNDAYLIQMRDYLNVIHDEFALLYNVVGNDEFAMDIEYKITSEDQLIIKQARPWSTFWSTVDVESESQVIEVVYFPNPTDNNLHFICDCNVTTLRIVNLLGQTIREQLVDFKDLNASISTQSLSTGSYLVYGLTSEGDVAFSKKFLKK